MADSVTVSTLYTKGQEFIQHLTNASDATGEAAVIKLNMSDLAVDGDAVTSITVISIEFIVSGMNHVKLAWDATTDDTIALLSGSGIIDFTPKGNRDPQTSGTTGDVVLTTDGAVTGGIYDIIVVYRLEV